MSAPPRQLTLGVLAMGIGGHVGGWRLPQARADGSHDIDFFIDWAQTAERACFDMFFFADSLAIRDRGGPASQARSHHIAQLEPLTALSAIAVHTRRIGLVATASTTYNEPYHVARKFASLDHISRGRAGWNMVTSFTQGEARNFNRAEHLAHDVRYRRAEEFVEVVTRLWDSLEQEAFVRDRQSGVHVDLSRMHRPDFKGEHFSVAGPLNVARPPQGRPVLIQAGASEDGQALAARTAELVFSAAESIGQAKAFNAGLREQVAALGRDAAGPRIMPGLFPIVGETEAQARELLDALNERVHPAIGLGQLSFMIGFDLSDYPLDGPLPDMPVSQGHQSRQRLLIDYARRENLTIRQLYQHVANGFGHKVMIGSADQVADEICTWFEEGAADGFNIIAPYLPGGFDAFCDLVVPRLQRRKVFKSSYAGSTLRDHLGLSIPSNRYR